MSEALNRAFIEQALDLVVTYLSGSSAQLESFEFGRRKQPWDQFEQEFRDRNALACSRRLQSLLTSLEAHFTSRARLERTESRGLFTGRLDLARYLATRHVVSRPREYPLLVWEQSPQTPENSLVAFILHSLEQALAACQFAASSAEGRAARQLYSDLRTSARRAPWRSVAVSGQSEIFAKATEQRLRKRQIPRAYAEVLRLYGLLVLDPSRLGATPHNEIVAGILAFAPSEGFGIGCWRSGRLAKWRELWRRLVARP